MLKKWKKKKEKIPLGDNLIQKERNSLFKKTKNSQVDDNYRAFIALIVVPYFVLFLYTYIFI